MRKNFLLLLLKTAGSSERPPKFLRTVLQSLFSFQELFLWLPLSQTKALLFFLVKAFFLPWILLSHVAGQLSLSLIHRNVIAASLQTQEYQLQLRLYLRAIHRILQGALSDSVLGLQQPQNG